MFPAELAVHLTEGEIFATNGRYLPEIAPLPRAEVRSAKARNVALGAVPVLGKLSITGKQRLMYFDRGLLAGEKFETRLAWRVLVRGLRASDGVGTVWTVFVDAHDADVLMTSDPTTCGMPHKDLLVQTVDDTFSETCWRLPGETDDFPLLDEDGPIGSYAGGHNDGEAAWDFTHQTYDFFHDNFGRHGWDGYDGPIEVMVEVGPPATNNAFYNPDCDQIWFADGMVVDDVFAHEYTHAITHRTAGLVYAGPSAALHEHYSDYFGALFTGDWQVGEAVSNLWRDMSDPASRGDPDHIDGYVEGGNPHANGSRLPGCQRLRVHWPVESGHRL